MAPKLFSPYYLLAPMIWCKFYHIRISGSIVCRQILHSLTDVMKGASPFVYFSETCCLEWHRVSQKVSAQHTDLCRNFIVSGPPSTPNVYFRSSTPSTLGAWHCAGSSIWSHHIACTAMQHKVSGNLCSLTHSVSAQTREKTMWALHQTTL